MNIFFKEYKLNKVLSLHEQMVFKFLACSVQEKNKFLLASFKLLIIPKIVPKPHQFFQIYIHDRLSEQF